MGQDILVLMGATGSGKSALALELAQRLPAVIINADAMQMVAELSIITARPSEKEMAAAEHALYGVIPASGPTSVARWLALVKPAVERAWSEGKLPMLVGGTGMYVKALMEGLAEVPPIPAAIREWVRGQNAPQLYAALMEKDPIMAARLKPGDTQRIARALEVIEATGSSLAEWQGRAAAPLLPEARYHCFALEVPRAQLYTRLDARFLEILKQGALAEVDALRKLNIPDDMPILRAVGVPQLLAHLAGEITLEEAITEAQQYTRNYAKRQMTWLRNQLEATVVTAGDAATQAADILSHVNDSKHKLV